MFSIWIVLLLKFFESLGFFTEFSTKNRSNRTYSTLLLLFHCLIGCLLVFICVNFQSKQFPELDDERVILTNGYIKYFSSSACYWLTVIELYTKRHNLTRFWQILGQIDQCHCQHTRFSIQIYFIKCIELLSVITVTHIFRTRYLMIDDPVTFWFVYTYFFAMKISICRSFYYLLYIEIIKHELRMIENEVREMVKCSENFGSAVKKLSGLHRFQENRFKWIREYYQLIYELTRCMNSTFGVSQLATIIFCFSILVTDLTWSYWTFKGKSHWQVFG